MHNAGMIYGYARVSTDAQDLTKSGGPAQGRRQPPPRAIARVAQAELIEVDALPPHRDLDDAVQLTEREADRHPECPAKPSG